ARSAVRETMNAWEPEELLEARGNTLALTIDSHLQEAVEASVASGVEKWQADCGGAVVMDVHTGAVLASVSYPTYDNNEFATADGGAIRNRIVTDPFETGSVMKLIMAAILVDLGLVTQDTLFDCEN